MKQIEAYKLSPKGEWLVNESISMSIKTGESLEVCFNLLMKVLEEGSLVNES